MGTSAAGSGAICQKCRMLLDTGFEFVDGQPACDNCAPGLKAELRARQAASLKLPGGWWTRAALFGAAAAAFGAFLYAAIVLATAFEPTFLVVGFGAAVGIAARAGAGNNGGTRLQVIAVVLVYAGLAAAYLAVAWLASTAGNLSGLAAEIAEFRTQFGDSPGAFAFAVSRPFTSGAVGLISLVLGFFASWRFCSEGPAGNTGQDLWNRLGGAAKD